MKTHKLIFIIILATFVVLTITFITTLLFNDDIVSNSCEVTGTVQYANETLFPIDCPGVMGQTESGYINRQGEIVLSDNKWTYTGFFNDDNLAIVENSRYQSAIVNKLGEYILDFEYNHIKYLGHSMYFIIKNNEENYLGSYQDKQMTLELIDYEWVYPFSEGLAAIKTSDEKIGFINVQREMVIDPTYDYHPKLDFIFHNNYVTLMKDEKYGVINQNEDKIVEFEYDYIESNELNKEYIKYQDKDNGLWGIMDDSYNIVIKASYKLMGSISDQLVAVSVDGESYAFFDLEHMIRTEFIYQKVESSLYQKSYNYFVNDMAVVSFDGETFNLINKSYQPLLEESVQGIRILNNEIVVLLREGDLVEILNINTKESIEMLYMDVELYPEFDLIAISVESNVEGSTLFKLMTPEGEPVLPDLSIYEDMTLITIENKKYLQFRGLMNGKRFSSYINENLEIVWQPTGKEN